MNDNECPGCGATDCTPATCPAYADYVGASDSGSVVPDRFTLSIEMGNELMTTPLHVAGALHLVTAKLAEGASVSGAIRDINGNLVGQWRFQ